MFVRGGGWDVKFRASTSYKDSVAQMSSGKFLYFISQAQCRYYFSKMDINDPPPSHPGFVNLVKRLTTSDRNSNDIIKFLKYYGTHCLSEVTLGARFLKKLEVSQTNYEEFRTKKISVEAQASYSGLGTKICRLQLSKIRGNKYHYSRGSSIQRRKWDDVVFLSCRRQSSLNTVLSVSRLQTIH